MSHPPQAAARPLPEPTVRMAEGWHCLHIYYRIDPKELQRLDAGARGHGKEELARLLDPGRQGAPQRF